MHDIRLYAFIGDCLTAKQNIPDLHTTIGFAKLCTSSGVELLRWLPDWIPTTTGFCCETLHQFWCETFTVIAWLTTYEYWLLLPNFAPVLVWNFYGDCLTDYLRLLAFAAKFCTSSGVKRLRWFIAWLTTYDYWLLLRNFAPVLVWNFYGDCLTDYLRLLAFSAKLLLWLSDDIPLWLLGYRKNELVRSNSGWQALTSAEKVTTRTNYQCGFKK